MSACSARIICFSAADDIVRLSAIIPSSSRIEPSNAFTPLPKFVISGLTFSPSESSFRHSLSCPLFSSVSERRRRIVVRASDGYRFVSVSSSPSSFVMRALFTSIPSISVFARVMRIMLSSTADCEVAPAVAASPSQSFLSFSSASLLFSARSSCPYAIASLKSSTSSESCAPAVLPIFWRCDVSVSAKNPSSRACSVLM